MVTVGPGPHARRPLSPGPAITDNGLMAVKPRWATRCTARSRLNNWQQCRAWAMSGQYVCRVHGGMTPNGLAAGQLRLAKRERDAVLARLFRGYDAKVEKAVAEERAALRQRVDELARGSRR